LISGLEAGEKGAIQGGRRGPGIKAKVCGFAVPGCFQCDVIFGGAPAEIDYEEWLGSGWWGGEGELGEGEYK
jgi:hypothetical protein